MNGHAGGYKVEAEKSKKAVRLSGRGFARRGNEGERRREAVLKRRREAAICRFSRESDKIMSHHGPALRTCHVQCTCYSKNVRGGVEAEKRLASVSSLWRVQK